MATMAKTSITLPKTLLDQTNILADRLNMTQNDLFQMAIEQFIERYKETRTTRIGDKQRVINQGDIYWFRLDNSSEVPSNIRHPYVVVQENVFNHSRMHTVVVCALTTNLKRAKLPGNVLLEVNEANLPKPSVVEVSKVSTVDKAQLGEYIGSLSQERIKDILAGMRFLHLSFFGS